jgi:hypothetical protein
MRSIRPALTVLALTCTLAIPHRALARAPEGTHPISPVVVERLSLIHPHAGHRDTVYARLVNGMAPITGARLTARLVVRGHTLGIVRGTSTNRHGDASARFIVPAVAAGRKLHVVVLLRYGKQVFTGTNTCFPS